MQSSIQMLCGQMASHRTFLLGRNVNLQQTAGLTRAVMEKLGLPQKPLKPLTPYFKFMVQVRPNIVKRHPESTMTAIAKFTSVEWTKVDTQQKKQLEMTYKKEWEAYLQAMKKYNSSLSEEHKLAIQQAEKEIKEKKIEKGLKLKMKELGKPKRYLSAFLLYMQDNAAKRGTMPPAEFSSKMGENWRKMPEAEKAQYEARSDKLRDQYMEELKKWENKMIRHGNLSLVRTNVLKDRQADIVASSRQATLSKAGPKRVTKQ